MRTHRIKPLLLRLRKINRAELLLWGNEAVEYHVSLSEPTECSQLVPADDASRGMYELSYMQRAGHRYILLERWVLTMFNVSWRIQRRNAWATSAKPRAALSSLPCPIIPRLRRRPSPRASHVPPSNKHQMNPGRKRKRGKRPKTREGCGSSGGGDGLLR